MLAQNQIDWFHDIKQAIKITSGLQYKDNRVHFSSILSQERYNDYVRSKVKIFPKSKDLEQITKNKSLLKSMNRDDISKFDFKGAKT